MAGYGVIPSIRVTDLPGALAFYTEQLGFTLLRGGPDEDNSSLSRGDARIMIERATAFFSPGYNDAIAGRMGQASPMALYIEAEDLEDLYTRVSENGARVVDPPAPRPWGQSEFTVEDPAGNWLTFWKADGQSSS